MASTEYDRLAGTAALAAGVGGIVYSIAFLGGIVAGAAIELGALVASAALLLGGLLTIVVMVALYGRTRDLSPPLALLGLVLALIGAAGATVHGGYDLSNRIHPPIVNVIAENALPNAIDPRGLLTFGFGGLGLLILARLLRRSGTAPAALGTLGMTVGALLVVIYLGRLIVLTPTNPLVAIPVALTGFVLSPAFYIWLGLVLRRR